MGPAGCSPLVILPTYNEYQNLLTIVSGIRQYNCEVLVVDDGSPDHTGELADRMARQDPGVHVLHRPRKLGLGSAYVAGFKFGLAHGYDLILEMDADGSHSPSYLPRLVEAASRIEGLAIGSRYVSGGSVHGWAWHRMILSRGANVYCRALLGIPIHDCTSGFRCYHGSVLAAISLDTIVSQGYSFQIEMVYRCMQLGYPVVEVPIRFEDRVAGKSKVSHGEIGRALSLVLRLRIESGRLSLGTVASQQEPIGVDVDAL